MASMTLGCALGIGYLMQMSSGDRTVPSAQASAVDPASADVFSQAFVGESPEPKDTAQTPVAVPVENKIEETAQAEEREAPVLPPSPGKSSFSMRLRW